MCFHFSEGEPEEEGPGVHTSGREWGECVPLGDRLRGKGGRKPARKGLSERLEGEVCGPPMTEGKQ